MLTSRKKGNHKKHTIKNFVVNELKWYIQYTSEKLWFLKVRNKFFDKLRNRGFRKYYLSKTWLLCHIHLEINICSQVTKFIWMLFRKRKQKRS